MKSITPFQELAKIEDQVHAEFDIKPSEKEIINFIETKELPKNDGGISLGIAIAALILQGWSVYRDEQMRKGQSPPPPNIPIDSDGNLPDQPLCPLEDCRQPSIPHFEPGTFYCKNGHIWRRE